MEADVRDLFDEDALFDPFEDVDADELDPAAAAQVTVASPLSAQEAAPRVAAAPAMDMRTAQERFRDLLKETPGQRRVMLSLVDYCREPKTGAEMDERTDELLRYGFSVFSSVVFRELLEEAGAIRYAMFDADGNEVAEDASAVAAGGGLPVGDGDRNGVSAGGAGGGAYGDETDSLGRAVAGGGDALLSEEYFDGQEAVELEFLEVARGRPGLWVATPEGLEVVDEQDDAGEIRKLLAAEPQYLDIYHQILDFCTLDGGRSAKEIDRLVNDSPLLEEPRRYSGYFVGRLERKGALEWRCGWCTTQVGRDMIAEALAAATQ